MPCYFSNRFLDEDQVYQACTCGKHAWSTISNKVILVNGRHFIKTRRNGCHTNIPICKNSDKYKYNHCLYLLCITVAALTWIWTVITYSNL